MLVVDDDQATREFEVHVLARAGYVVEQAADGRAAIATLERSPADLVLLDLVMPGVDGWEVLDHISRQAPAPRVIVVTGQEEVALPRHGASPVSGYLRKPFGVDQLLRLCRTALQAAPAASSGGNRRGLRRGFVVETTLLSDAGGGLLRANMLDVSQRGFRLEVEIPFKIGDAVRIAFRIPGRPEALCVTGRVRWQNETALGAEIQDLRTEDATVLKGLVGF